VHGKKTYIGLLSPDELEQANKISDDLEKRIPELELELNNKYPDRKDKIYLAHEFGSYLRKLVDEYNIKGHQESIFWNQIRDFASKEEDGPQDRNKSNRMIYDYYYQLAYYPLKDVENITWSNWSQLFDTSSINSEKKVIDWIVNKGKTEKHKRDIFRDLMTGIRLYVQGKDLTVFSDEQLFEKMNLVYKISKIKDELYERYFTNLNIKPSEARLKRKKHYREKYYKEIYKRLKINKKQNINSLCDEVFKKVYNVKVTEWC